ncbi:hypothetical protein ABPG77_007727 [Micractinium sp. CCAP 211/92]
MIVLALYLWALSEWPLPVKAVTSALLAAASDLVAQRLLGARRVSWRRSMLMSLFGLCWYGPSNHAWQGLLVRLFPPVPRGRGSAVGGLLRIAQRVGLDQLLYAPVNNCLMILYVSLVADRRGWRAARAKVVSELPGVQRRGWRVWPVLQLVNQSVVPLEFRVLVNNVCSLCWTAFVIMSTRGAAHRKLPVYSMSTARLHPHDN